MLSLSSWKCTLDIGRPIIAGKDGTRRIRLGRGLSGFERPRFNHLDVIHMGRVQETGISTAGRCY
jgi:hypothetical protein